MTDEHSFVDVVDDIKQIDFQAGKPGEDYKYKAYIPKDIWNKWRPEKMLQRGDYKTITFGSQGYQHYKDRIKEWSNLDHKDKKRREKYRARHEKIKVKDGRYSYQVPFTSEFFSYYFLW